jgi:hypothetical protein
MPRKRFTVERILLKLRKASSTLSTRLRGPTVHPATNASAERRRRQIPRLKGK